MKLAILLLAACNIPNVHFTGSDAGGTAGNKGAVDYLTGLGLTVEWSQPPGGMHAWHSWRGYFRDLMADKFFTATPFATAKVGTPR